MANVNYVAVADLKNIYAPGVDYSAISDATVSGMISAASRWVDSFTQAPNGWDYETLTNEQYDSNTNAHIDADGNLIIFPSKRPVDPAAVTGINIFVGGYSNNLQLTADGNSILGIPAAGNMIFYPNTYMVSIGTLLGGQGKLNQLRSFRYGVKLSYSGGYRTIPEEIKLAVGLYFQQLVSNKFNPTGGIEVRQGSMSIKYAGGKGQESPLTLQAKDLLNNLVRVV